MSPEESLGGILKLLRRSVRPSDHLWMDLTHTWIKQHLWPNWHVEWFWLDLDMTLTGKVRFFKFALIVISFSFMDGFNNNIDDLTEMLDDFDMTLTGNVRFFNFALIVVTFSLKDEFNSYFWQKNLFGDLNKTLTDKVTWPLCDLDRWGLLLQFYYNCKQHLWLKWHVVWFKSPFLWPRPTCGFPMLKN